MQRLLMILGLSLAFQAGADEVVPAGSEVSANRCAHTSESFKCVNYVRNYDGDTFTVNIPQVHPLIGSMITVRVNGVDSPEMEGETACERQAAYKAQQETQKWLENAKRIDLIQTKRDKYFRVLADVKVDGKSLAEHLIEEGMAVPYDGGHKEKVDWCKRR